MFGAHTWSDDEQLITYGTICSVNNVLYQMNPLLYLELDQNNFHLISSPS
jgi:hypothetical protein